MTSRVKNDSSPASVERLVRPAALAAEPKPLQMTQPLPIRRPRRPWSDEMECEPLPRILGTLRLSPSGGGDSGSPILLPPLPLPPLVLSTSPSRTLDSPRWPSPLPPRDVVFHDKLPGR